LQFIGFLHDLLLVFYLTPKHHMVHHILGDKDICALRQS
jgi:hypothetical protein